MNFSDLFFIYAFLPLCLLCYFISPKLKIKNIVLTVFSLIFYAWGEIRYVPLFFVLLTLDYALGRLLMRAQARSSRKWLLAAGVIADIGALLYYKYSGFLLETLGLGGRFATPSTLPLGISFFTFQAVGYLIDV